MSIATAAITPPGPKGIALWKALREMQKSPLDTFSRDIDTYGSIVHYSFPKRAFTIISDPVHVYRVLNGDAGHTSKDTFTYRQIGKFAGNGLFTANGEPWQRYRPFYQKMLAPGQVEAMSTEMEKTIKCWLAESLSGMTSEKPIDIGFEMQKLALRVVCRVLLGYPITDSIDTVCMAVQRVLKITNDRIRNPMFVQMELLSNRGSRFSQSLSVLQAFADDIIAYSRSMGASSPFWDYLELEVAEAGEKEIRDQILTLFLAGHETTAAVLTWFFYLMALNPEWQERLRRDYVRMEEDRNSQTHGLLDCAIMETLRLYPPVWLFERKVKQEIRISRYRIPAGSTVAIFCYHIHRNPKWWEDAGSFKPERFSGESGKKIGRYTYLPFGGGPRYCVGSHFALQELRMISGIMLERFRIHNFGQQSVTPQAGLTLRPNKRIQVILEEL